MCGRQQLMVYKPRTNYIGVRVVGPFEVIHKHNYYYMVNVVQVKDDQWFEVNTSNSWNLRLAFGYTCLSLVHLTFDFDHPLHTLLTD